MHRNAISRNGSPAQTSERRAGRLERRTTRQVLSVDGLIERVQLDPRGGSPTARPPDRPTAQLRSAVGSFLTRPARRA